MAFTYTVSNNSYYFYRVSENVYCSNNTGVHSTTAQTAFDFNTNGSSYKLYLDCLNYGENNYDYGYITYNGTTYSFQGKNSDSIQTIDLGEVSGTGRFIASYRKDGSVSSGADRLQITIRAEQLGYKLTYNCFGGISASPLTTFSSTMPELPQLSKKNCIFLGWYLDSEYNNQCNIASGTELSTDISLWAKFRYPTKQISLADYDISVGSHNITVVAKAQGCRKSQPSQSVTFTGALIYQNNREIILKDASITQTGNTVTLE